MATPSPLRPVTASRDAKASSEPAADKSSARIVEALPGIDLIASASASGVNSFFVLAAAPKDPSITFLVDAPGLTLMLDKQSGSIALVDKAGTSIGSFLTPYAVDSTPDEFTGGGRITSDVTYSISTIDGTPAVTVTVDPDWLASAVYPVYVDPTIYNNGSTTYGDAHVNQGNPNLNYANYQRPDSPGYYEMWLGESPSDSSYYNEAYIKFDLSSISGTTIDSATIEVRPYHQYYNAPTSTTTWLRRVVNAGTWAENTIKWSNKPAVNSTPVDTAACIEGQQCAFGVTSLVRGWLDGTYTNNGIRLDENGNGPTYWKRLIASEEQTSSRPRLLITNHVPVATPTTPTGWRNSRTLAWTYSDAAGHAQSNYEFDVDNNSDFSSLTYDGPQTAGAATSAAIPGGAALVDGTTYHWRIRVKDGTSWSAWATSSFQWDATPPSATIAIQSGAAYATATGVTLNVTSSDTHSGVSTTQASNDNSTYTSVTGASPTWTLSSPNGTKTVWYRVTDAAGNAATVSDTIVLDTVDPVATIAINSGAATTSSTTVTLNVTASDATSGVATTHASNDNVTYTSVSGTSPTWTLTNGDGTKTVWYRVVDVAGRSTTVSDTIVLNTDTTPPDPPGAPDLDASSDSGMSSTDNITQVISPTFTGTAEANSFVKVYSGTELKGSTTANGSGAWAVTTSALNSGTHTITATATDAWNNTSASSDPLSLTIDLDDPNVLMGVNEGATKSSSQTVEIQLQADDATSDVVVVEASNDNVAFIALSGPTPLWTLAPGDGIKTVWVRVTDAAGRTSTSSDSITLDSNLAPVALGTTSLAVTMERGTSRDEGVTLTPSLVLYGATLDISASLAAVTEPPLPAGPFRAMGEVEFIAAVRLNVQQSAGLGSYVGTLILRASDGTALGTVNISVTVVDPPVGVVPATVSAPSSDRLVVDADGDSVVIDTVVVGLEFNTVDPAQRILAMALDHNGIVRGQVPGARIYQVQVPGTDDVVELEALRQSLEAEADVAFVPASYDAELTDLAPNDTEWHDVWDENAVGGRNWSMEIIKMPSTWQFETGDRSVPVAILDIGMDFDHPDLAANVDVYNDDLGKRPPGQKHGTHVSGIACAVGNNNLGVTGVAWACSLRGYEIGGANRHEQITALMRKAAEDGARVVNLSAGRNFHNEFCNNNNQKKLDETTAIYRQAIQTVIDDGHDVLWVIAAGDEPCDAALTTPANLSAEFANVMSIASVNDRAELSNFSPRGASVTVAAAGGQAPEIGPLGAQSILSTVPGNCGLIEWFCSRYGMDRGTSMAAPQVTGLAALVLSSHPDLTALQVKDCILSGAEANGAAIEGEAFHVIHAPSAVDCGPELLAVTNDEWRTLELSWAGGVTNLEPTTWKTNGFDDSGWSDAYIPPDPYPAWIDIGDAEWLSSTGRSTGHLTSEIWITRREFEIPDAITSGAILTWNVDNTASIWINGNLVASGGTWSSVTTTSIPQAFLQEGTNTIAAKVFQDGAANNWTVNPTFIQMKLVMP
jgi:hypothetical protein